MALTQTGVARAPQPAGLYEVLDLILDKGLVVDVYVRLSLVGIEILTLDARIVIASVDTYLRYAEAVGRLNIAKEDDKAGLPDLTSRLEQGGAQGKTQGALRGVGESLSQAFRGGGEGESGQPQQSQRSSSQSQQSAGQSQQGQSGNQSDSGERGGRRSEGQGDGGQEKSG